MSSVDPKTASMHYQVDSMDEATLHLGTRVGFATDIPAWSLSDLLALMPPTITVDGVVYRHVLRKWYDQEYEINSYEFAYETLDNAAPAKGSWHDAGSIIIAAYHMVQWLAENNHLNV